MTKNQFLTVKKILDEKSIFYNNPAFIENDPIQIPHRFNRKQDVEIASFLTATIAWGNRKSIIQNANRMLEYMDNQPYEFIQNFTETDTKHWKKAIHRTFFADDLRYFCLALQRLYTNHNSLETYFVPKENETNLFTAIERFRKHFFSLEHEARTEKHLSNPAKKSSCKRLHMMLRWLVRKDSQGVDFGIWNHIPMHKLSCPLDIHSGNTARKLGIVTRNSNDRKTVEELDAFLRNCNPIDPAAYDFALFGMSVENTVDFTLK